MAVTKEQKEQFKIGITADISRRGKEWGQKAIDRWNATLIHPSFKDIQSEPGNIETPENLKMWIQVTGDVLANIEEPVEEVVSAPVVETPPMPEPIPSPESPPVDDPAITGIPV